MQKQECKAVASSADIYLTNKDLAGKSISVKLYSSTAKTWKDLPSLKKKNQLFRSCFYAKVVCNQ